MRGRSGPENTRSELQYSRIAYFKNTGLCKKPLYALSFPARTEEESQPKAMDGITFRLALSALVQLEQSQYQHRAAQFTKRILGFEGLADGEMAGFLVRHSGNG